MADANFDTHIRAWLREMPGPIFASDGNETLKLALAASGVDCSLADFTACLRRYGFMPQPRGHGEGVHFVLALREKPGTMASPFAGRPSRVRDRADGVS